MKKERTKLLKGAEVLQIGYGRLGKPFYNYLSSHIEGEPLLIKNSKDHIPVFENIKYIFVCTTDSVLDQLISKYSGKNKKIVHFSGSRYFDEAVGIHPVYSFPISNEVISFKNIEYVVDKTLDDFFLERLFPKKQLIDKNKKEDYHLHLSLSANYIQLLASEMADSFSLATGLNKSLALKIIKQSVENVEKYGEKSFSGPWIRNEREFQDNIAREHSSKIINLINKNFKNLIELYKRRKNENS